MTDIDTYLEEVLKEASKPIQFRDGVSAHDGVQITHMNEDRQRLVRYCQKLREALDFYANKYKWKDIVKEYDDKFGYVAYTAIQLDEGDMAREALNLKLEDLE